MFARAALDLPIAVPGDGSATIQIVDVEDMALVLVEAVTRQIAGVINVPGSAPMSLFGFLESCALRANSRPTFRPILIDQDKYDERRWPFPNLNLCVSGEQYTAKFRHRCLSAQASIDRSYAWWNTLSSPMRYASVDSVEHV